MMDGVNLTDIVSRLGSSEDAVRKMAVFKLQSNIGDPSFADIFIAEGGLRILKDLVLHATGNTLAYSLTSLSRLLDVDKGWESVNQDLVERIVELVVTHPLVNILRGAMSILVSIVSHAHDPESEMSPKEGLFGFQALRPAIAVYPRFLEMLVSRLSSADHALCANSLQLINSLMRDSITRGPDNEWPKFMEQLKCLGVMKAVYTLMEGTALQDLAQPLLEFQTLTKILLRRWRDIPVDMANYEHRRILMSVYHLSYPDRRDPSPIVGNVLINAVKGLEYEKWRRLGFDSENPQWEFADMGFLGLMDLITYVQEHSIEFQKLLLEQSTRPFKERYPVAKASLAISAILYEHFEVSKSEGEDSKNYLALESRSDYERVFKPLLLHWSRLHVAGLRIFFLLWRFTGAEAEDFPKVVELVRILIESVVSGAPRTKDIQDIEEEMHDFDYGRLRELQMELLELAHEDAWGQHLLQMRDELHQEALQFIKEQRTRCLLRGAWFPMEVDRKYDGQHDVKLYRYVQLSHNRRYLHYADFDSLSKTPHLDTLVNKIDLNIVSSVVSNVSAPNDDSSGSTIKTLPHHLLSATKITIHGSNCQDIPLASASSSSKKNQQINKSDGEKDDVLLVLYPQSHIVASEWLDGLLMLLNQQPITAETNRLLNLVGNYGLKIRLLNVRFDDTAFISDPPKIPTRENLNEDYYFDVFG